jgi:hypothetical protein
MSPQLWQRHLFGSAHSVYRAVACQRVDQIRYNIVTIVEILDLGDYYGLLLWLRCGGGDWKCVHSYGSDTCWEAPTVFTEMLPGNALIKSVTILLR